MARGHGHDTSLYLTTTYNRKLLQQACEQSLKTVEKGLVRLTSSLCSHLSPGGDDGQSQGLREGKPGESTPT